MDVKTAERIAAKELATLPSRHEHVRAVAELATSVGRMLVPDDCQILVAAAHLHDVGYAPRLVRTGFHPLDGAEWLASIGEIRLANLVAHHTGAVHEARHRGLTGELAAFEREASLVADLLSWCDLNRGPHGQPITAEARLQDVAQRYGPDHPVTRSLAEARSELLASCARVESLLSHVK